MRCHMVSGVFVNTYSGNGLLSYRCWAIISTSADLLKIGTHGNKVQSNWNQNTNIFIEENEFENVVCKVQAILFWPQCVTSQKQTVVL